MERDTIIDQLLEIIGVLVFVIVMFIASPVLFN